MFIDLKSFDKTEGALSFMLKRLTKLRLPSVLGCGSCSMDFQCFWKLLLKFELTSALCFSSFPILVFSFVLEAFGKTEGA